MEYFVHLGADSVDAIKQACGTEVEELNVTENGTYNAPSGKAYNPVTVNVESGGGDSDFSTAMVKDLGFNTEMPISLLTGLCYIAKSPVEDEITSSPIPYEMALDGLEYKIVLYKGVAKGFLEAQSADVYTITVTGDISYEYSEDEGAFIITIEGDGTILIGEGK